METLDPDSLSKSAKKKKELDCQAGKLNRKISDFFKTPDKQNDKQKQKSLLQFFTKSGQNENGKSDTNCSVNEKEEHDLEVITPTNSDKENSEEVQVDADDGACKPKSRKELNEKFCNEGNSKNKKGRRSKVNSSTEQKEKIKHKKNKKVQEYQGDADNSDSIILLSDSSLSQPSTDSQAKMDSNKIEPSPGEKQTYASFEKRLEIDSETSTKIKIDCEDSDLVEMESKSSIENGTLVNNDNKNTCEIKGAKSNKDSVSVNKDITVKPSSKKVSNKAEKKQKPRKNSEALIGLAEEKIDNAEKEKDEIRCLEKQISEKRNSKKSALKGKDMLNLLKEIQSEETSVVKKRKHKKKHKHHKSKGNDVFEIAISEDNSDGKEEKAEECQRAVETGNETEKKETDSSESKNEITGTNSVNKDNYDEHDGVDLNLETSKKSNKKKEVGIKSKNKEHNLLKQEKQKNKKSAKMASSKEDYKLSYEDFSVTLDCMKSQLPPKSTGNQKEISYTDYLKQLEQSCGTDNVDSDDHIDEGNHTNLDGELQTQPSEDVVSTDGELVLEKKNIKTFFSVITSTPARGTFSKTSAALPAKKVKNGTSLNTEKCKAEPDEIVIDKIVESEMEVDQANDSDIDIVLVKENVELKGEMPKSDTHCKVQNSGKATQATLSFGKTGLTVSKIVSKIAEEVTNKESIPNSQKDDDSVGPVKKKTGKRGRPRKVEIPNDIDRTKSGKRGRPRKVEISADIDCTETEKLERPRKVEIPVDIDCTDSSVFATPENKRKKKAKRKLEEDDSESAESGERRRSLRKRYKVEAFQMDVEKKTPIKIKLKRCPKSSSSGEDSEKSTMNTQKLKVNSKQSTAMALLEKAKRGRHKKHKLNSKLSLIKKKDSKKKLKSRKGSNSSEESLTRRSSRLEGQVRASMEEVSLENIVISSSEDEGEDMKRMKRRGRPKGSKNKPLSDSAVVDVTKGTPKKNLLKNTGTPTKNKTPSKKSGMKLAPMFMLGKAKGAQPSPKKVELDPETLKQRQAFLMSGVPEALRKQTATRIASQVEADYPPIPRTSHVLQVPSDSIDQPNTFNVWDLKPVGLTLRQFVMPLSVSPVCKFTGGLIVKSSRETFSEIDFKEFKGHAAITDELVDLCRKEIASFNSTYPVNNMYKALKEMKTETEAPPAKSESMLKTDMKGILEGCTDMAVIEDEDTGQQNKKKKKNLKLQKKAEVTVPSEEAKEEKAKPAGSGLLWTEKYCPAKTGDVLGNSGVLKKLKTWLTEWKHVLDREARKARKLLLKKNKGKQMTNKKADDDLWDDDSDFDLDSDASDEDDALCNTMLLTGPHGCGKTSSVYALALELGFKVHEVNASCCRSGKQILSQLQEATQSHQVSSQGNHTPRKNTALGDKPKPENKMATAFTNLFKKAEPNAENKQEEKPIGKKRKRNTSDKDGGGKSKIKSGERTAEGKHKSLQLLLEDSSSQNVTKSLNLSSTTLILFDEVDVVFDEDKGFLSAIQNFMSNTKIPIILTTADLGFSHTFEGRYEQMTFKRPSLASITSHLQTVSLVENVRTDPVLLSELALFYHCDMRRCLVALQYLLESGGGHCSLLKDIQTMMQSKNTANILGLESENSQNCLQADGCGPVNAIKASNVDIVARSEASRGSVDSDDDFVAIKPLKKRRRVLEDDNSNSVDTCITVPDIQSVEPAPVQDSRIARICPSLHQVGLESLYSTRLNIVNTLSQGLKVSSASSLENLICTCCCVKTGTHSDLMYNNLPQLLPFSTTVVSTVLKVSKDCTSKPKTRKRIKLQSDLYDSEASNDALIETEDKLENNPGDKQGDNQGSENVLVESESVLKESSSENLCLSKSLSYLTKFYDAMSSLDTLDSRGRLKCNAIVACTGRDVKGSLVAGMENVTPSFQTYGEIDLDTARNYSAEIEARSFSKLYDETSAMSGEIEKICTDNEMFAENFVLPIRRENEQITLTDTCSVIIPGEYKKACENTVDNLPLVIQSHNRRIHLDYLPTLRDICRSEQCRQITNTKRRFHHYFDNITLPLKDRTVTTLATTLV